MSTFTMIDLTLQRYENSFDLINLTLLLTIISFDLIDLTLEPDYKPSFAPGFCRPTKSIWGTGLFELTLSHAPAKATILRRSSS